MKDILLMIAIACSVILAIALNKNNKYYETTIKMQQMHLIQMQDEINVKDSVIIDLYEPIVRLQLACGIKNPDTTFTYIEKVLNPCNIHLINKIDLR